jgi:hypothetical protein
MLALSIVLLVVGLPLVAWVAARIYRVGILNVRQASPTTGASVLDQGLGSRTVITIDSEQTTDTACLVGVRV